MFLIWANKGHQENPPHLISCRNIIYGSIIIITIHYLLSEWHSVLHACVGGRLFLSRGSSCHCEGLLVLSSNPVSQRKLLMGIFTNSDALPPNYHSSTKSICSRFLLFHKTCPDLDTFGLHHGAKADFECSAAKAIQSCYEPIKTGLRRTECGVTLRQRTSSSATVLRPELTACQASQKASLRRVNNWCRWIWKEENRNTTSLWPLLVHYSRGGLRGQEARSGRWEKAISWGCTAPGPADCLCRWDLRVTVPGAVMMESGKTSSRQRVKRWSAETCLALRRLDCFTCVSSTSHS